MNKKNDLSVIFLFFYLLLFAALSCQAKLEVEEEDSEKQEKPVAAGTRKTLNNIAAKIEEVPLEVKVAEHVYLGSFVNPWEFGDPHELIEFEFEDAELSGFIKYIEEHFQLTFITDDILKPLPKDGRSILGQKISFKSHKPFTKKDAWAIFLKFLDIAGLTVTPGPAHNIYRITTIDPKSPLAATKNPLPVYIGTNPQALPDNDMYVRYVYFARDVDIKTVMAILDSMRSAASPNLIQIQELNAVLVTDKAYNIKTMFNIITELDTVSMPETMSIIKLKRTDAKKVADLYKSIIAEDEKNNPSLASRIMGARRPQTLTYFSPGTKVIPEPRTNTLILLGTQEAVKKIEDFILNEIDKEIEKPYTPIHVYPLKHVQAQAVADILMKVVAFQGGEDVAKTGGIRDGNYVFKKGVSIVPEKSGNRLIITADYESYLKLHEVLEKIDVEQPQVAIKVLIIDIDVTDAEQFGTQIRNKVPGTNGLTSDNVNFQTSGLYGLAPITENTVTGSTGATRLLGNLVTLASTTSGSTVGSTLLTLGSDCYGVWGILNMLQTYTNVSVVSNPFLVTTNNYPAEVTVGTTRRIIVANTIGAAGNTTASFNNLSATITVKITPRISYEGFINLDVMVTDNAFTSSVETNGNRIERIVNTSVVLANNEVLALGGLTQDTFSETESKVPILGDIPIVGWLFKNKSKTKERTSTIVLIAPEIIPTGNEDIPHDFSAQIVKDAEKSITMSDYKGQKMDPVHRWFFNDMVNDEIDEINQFVNHEKRYILPHQKEQVAERKTKRLSDFL